MNTVIAGDYKDKNVRMAGNKVFIESWGGPVKIDKKHVERYELADKDTLHKFNYGRALVGTVVMGGIGAVAGIGAKNKNIYQIAIYFRNGESSLVEVDDKVYKAIVAQLFNVENYDPSASPQTKSKLKKPIVGIATFLISLIICLIIVNSVFPAEDGVIHLNWFGTLFIIGVPIIATIVVPKLILKENNKTESQSNLNDEDTPAN